ncbi:ABC transporter permease [Nocardioides marinquilinus]|uniref:ABC transporter permease n=1 Tax=Nocardioides marinquilinus TaxID=1210400 RepID=A0ABP9PWK6_9ACTN
MGGGESLGDFHEEPEPVAAADGKAKKAVTGKSPTRIALSRLAHDKLAIFCSAIIVILIALAIFAPWICDWLNIFPNQDSPDAPTPSEVLDQDVLFGNPGYPLVGPPYHGFTWDHPLGLAPKTGYDNLAVLLYGLRTSLVVATLATIIAVAVGVTLGLIAGYAKGVVDGLLSFIIDFFLSFPFVLGALALAPIITSNFGDTQTTLRNAEFIALIGVLVLFGWMGMARLIRGQVLSLREREFIQAARVIGVPTRQILFKELLPNLVAPIVVAISLALPGYVAAEAGLSFLGIGLSEATSLGKTVDVARQYYREYGLYLWTPVITIMILVIALNLLGDSVRDAFDPKTRR